MSILRKEIVDVKLELGIFHLIPCTSEENEKYKEMEQKEDDLPIDIIKPYSSPNPRYEKIVESDLSSEEINKLMMYRQTLYLKSIKSSMTFFVVLAIISLIASVILAFAF